MPSPYSINWNTNTATNAQHTITAVAKDTSGTTASHSVNVTVFNPPVTPPPTPVLVAAYSFNEGQGLVATDLSGSNHGTIAGGHSWTAGRYGNALSLDGVTGKVTVPDATALDFTTGFTLEAWVYPTSALTGWKAIIVKEYVYYLYANNGGTNKMFCGAVIGGQPRGLNSSTPIPIGVWTHLAMTYDGAVFSLYVNGVLASNMSVTGTVATTNNNLWVGASNYGEYFPGRLDDIRIYNAALTQAAIVSDMNTALIGPVDTTPPVISSVASSNVTSSSARVTWTTNEASDTQIDYGLTSSYGSSSTLNSSLVTSHQVDLVSLLPSTTYHYRVKSRDVYNNLSTSGDFTFETAAAADVTPPVISDITVSNIGPSSARISWTTNEASDTQADYGLSASYGSFTLPDTSLVLSHVVNLVGLLPSTLYHYRPKSRDGAGNLTSAADGTFTTLAAPDGTPPVLSNITNSNPTSSSTSITWTTNEPSTSQVEYGLTTGYGNSSAFDSSLVVSHTAPLNGLVPSTIYHYRVKSQDSVGNLATSADFTFVTAPAPDTIPPIVSSGLPTGTLPAGTITATLSVTTNEPATCRYMTVPSVEYSLMENTFSTTGGLTHSTTVSELVNGATYRYYVRAIDSSTNANPADYVITFSISDPPPPIPTVTPSITVLAPNGGETWKTGNNKLIMWTSTGFDSNVNIELLKDGNYTMIFSDVPNTGSISWKPTGPKSSFCKVRISSINGAVVDSSNEFFKIG